jgi:hypothetical protein
LPTTLAWNWIRISGAAMLFLVASTVLAQPAAPTPVAPPVDPMPAQATPLPGIEEPGPGPAPATPEPAPPKAAGEAFSSLGGFSAGPGGGVGALLSPTVGNMPVRASLAVTWFPPEAVHFQATTLGVYREDFSLSAPIWQDDRNEWSLSTNLRSEEFHTGAILPTTQQAFPDQLVDVRFGTSFRHQFDNDWIAGIGGSFGSASDQPFHGVNELTAGVNAFLRVPQGDHNAWLFTLSYSTNSQINVPIPGVAYLWVPSDCFQAVIGFPFASLNYRPTEDLTLSLSYALLTTIHARATYRLAPRLRVYTAFDWDNESYFRVGREDDRDRFFYYEKRLSAGVQYSLSPRMNLDLSGGYAFDRFFFEGQSLTDRDNNRIDIGDGPYVSLKLLFHY